MRSRLLLAIVAMFGLPTLAQAQPNRNQAILQRQMQPPQFIAQVTIQGEIEGIVRGGIIVAGDNNRRWQVIIPPNIEAQVTGEATADYLRPGLLVEFEAQLDGRSMKDKVGALTIITPSPAKQLSMVLMEASEGAAGGAGTKPAKRGTTVPGKYHIIGQLTAGRGGKFNFQAGRGSLPLELADQVAVKVDVADLTIATIGDKVTITGNKAEGPINLAKASRVRIVLTKPLGGTPAKTKATPVKKPAKRPTKGTDASKPAAEQ